MNHVIVVTNEHGHHEVRLGKFVFDTFFGRYPNALENATKFAERLNNHEGDLDLVDFYSSLNNDE